jgi:ADP-ribose pyrophosphatase YjhB (NUDIX family)
MSDKLIPGHVRQTVAKGSDKKVHRFPRPTVAVDTALLTLDPKLGLVVVEMARDDIKPGTWALPGAFLREEETLADAVDRSLHAKVGIRGIRPTQLHVFDDPHRDPRDWVISVAHVAVVQPGKLGSLGEGSAKVVRLAPVDRPGRLVWDHPKILERAKSYIRTRYEVTPDPDALLKDPFTLAELQRVHEAVAGEGLRRDKFRRTMEHQLIGTGIYENTGSRGRPAELFRRRSARDRSL